MRTLFSIHAGAEHFWPLEPVARTLVQAGHEVAICAPRSTHAAVEACGLTFFEAGLDWPALINGFTGQPLLPLPPFGPAWAHRVFAELTPHYMIPDLLAVANQWHPELIIRDATEYAGAIAAEYLGLPHASVVVDAFSAIDSPEWESITGNRMMVADALAQHRAAYELPPDPTVQMLYHYLHLCFMPPSWDGSDMPRPAHTQFLRYIPRELPVGGLPDWMDTLPAQPTIYVDLGTLSGISERIVQAIVQGLDEEQVTVIIKIDHEEEARHFEPQPDYVHFTSSAPHAEMFSRCHLFISDGILRNLKEALVAGTPVLVIPLSSFTDQLYCAERCAALELGRMIPPQTCTADAIREAVRALLADSSYRDHAKHFQEEMLALPGSDYLLHLLEALITRRS